MGIPGIPEGGRSFGAVFRDIMRQGLGRTAEQRSERPDWTRADLAHALGWDPKTVGNWLNDKVFPSDRNMDELAALCRRTVSDDHPLLVELRAARDAPRRDEARSEAPSLTTLPPKPDRFGRGPELDALLEALAAPRPAILLTGPPGIGKSHLSLQALHDPACAARYVDRRWFVRLDGATTAAAVYPEIARAIGIESGSGLDAAIDARLAEAPGLLVLDNAETPWWPEPRASEAVLARLTAIEPLALVVSIRGDRAPPEPRWTRTIPIHVLDEEDARDLFNAQTGNRFKDDPDLADLLTDMAGVPLAIELLAKAIGTSETDLARTRRRWQDRRTALLAARRDAEGRLESWEISLRLSLDQLGAGSPEHRLFALMGHLPDGVAEDHLGALLGEPGIDAADRLAELALIREQAARYRMLAPIRAFAADHCTVDLADDDRRLAHYCNLAALGQQVGQEGGAEARCRLERDLRNIERTIADGLAATGSTRAIEAAIRLRNFIRFGGFDGSAILESAEQRSAEIDRSDLQAQCAFALGDINLRRSEPNVASTHYRRARRIYKTIGDQRGEANCIRNLGNIAIASSDIPAAQALFAEAIPILRNLGDARADADKLRFRGYSCMRTKPDAAVVYFEAAIPLYRAAGSSHGETESMEALGKIAFGRSNYDAASAYFISSLEIYQQKGLIISAARCIKLLGDIAIAQKKPSIAKELYEKCIAVFQREVPSLRTPSFHNVAIEDLLTFAEPVSDDAAYICTPTEIVRQIGEALGLYEGYPKPFSMGLARYHLAILATGAERAAHLAEARRLWEPLRLPHLLALLDRIAEEPTGSDP